MNLESSLDMTSNGVARITLTGKMDANNADEFKKLIEQAVASKARRLALLMGGLTFMASAGLRTLVFAKQKLGSAVDIYVIAAQDQIVETLSMTGLTDSVFMLDDYDSAIVEKF